MRKLDAGIATIAFVLLSGQASSATVARRPFGALPDGTAVEAVTLSDAKGISATIITLGSSITVAYWAEL